MNEQSSTVSPLRKHLVVLKLGGGLITDKTKPLAPKSNVIAFLATEVAQLYRMGKVDLLIGTGAGSYGHFSAHKYNLRDGAATPEQLVGMAMTHHEVRTLNALVADELLTRDVPAFTMSPSSFMACRNQTLTDVHVEPIEILLRNRCVPLVHGDTITDSQRGTTIYSTEEVLNVCLTRLKDSYDLITVIYLLNEAGVMDGSGNVIATLDAKTAVETQALLPHDVTGGIITKIREARRALECANAVYIISGHQTGAIADAIAGRRVGTRII